MATDCDDRAHIGPAHVDNKIVQEVLRAATGDTLKHAPQLVQKQWCKLRVQSPHHEGCVNADSSVRSSSFLFCNQQVRRISRKSPSGGAWLHDGHVLADHDTWSNPQLQALVQTHARIIQEYKCVERQLQGPAPAAPVVDRPKPTLLSSFPLLTN